MESFLALSFLFWIILIIRGKEKFNVPGFFWPLLAYAGLSLVACAFSVNSATSFKDARELLLYLIIPITMAAASVPRARFLTTTSLLLSGFLSILYSLGYSILKAEPGERIQGFMGHYMTQAGLLLLFLCAALSFFLFSREWTRWFWGAAIPLAGFCLALTLTRSAWVGFAVAAAFILFLYKPKALILIPVAAGILFLLSPQQMKRRALSIFSLSNYTNQLRIQYLKAGIKIIGEKPLLGTGPDTVDMVFQDPKYGLSGEARTNVHLHNNIVQIAAERGIPTLLAWLAFVVSTFISLLALLKKREPVVFPYAAAAGASLLALFTAGLFEYNFADSEIAVLFLYLIALPFAAEKVVQP
jgi:O-antigen ligase